jgi:hypothetical protein
MMSEISAVTALTQICFALPLNHFPHPLGLA